MRGMSLRSLGRLTLAPAMLLLTATPAVGAVLVVDDDGQYDVVTGDCNGTPDSAYTTINAALAVASDGDTILVCTGTYTEQVSITIPNLTLVGEGASNTVLRPSLVLPNATSLATGRPIAAILLVDGVAGVTIKDLTVDGSGAAFNACLPGYMGTYYRASSGTIDGIHVKDIVHPGALGCQAVIGIFVQSTNGGAGLNSNVSITGNTISNYGKNGVTANEAGTAVTITDNVIIGRGPLGLGDAAQNGIQLGWGARGLVSRNAISGNNYTPTDWVACGLLFYQAGGGLGRAKSNTLSANEQDYCNTAAQPSVHSPFND